MGFVKWLGRVTLWVVFLPLGLWRSVVHGRKKSEERQAKLIAGALREDRERQEAAAREDRERREAANIEPRKGVD